MTPAIRQRLAWWVAWGAQARAGRRQRVAGDVGELGRQDTLGGSGGPSFVIQCDRGWCKKRGTGPVG